MPLVLNSSDVSAVPKLAAKTIHGCIVLAQMRHIFQKEFPFVLTKIRRYYKSKVLIEGVVQWQLK